MLLQSSSLDVMKAYIRVSAAEKDKVGRRRAMFQRWKNYILVI